MLCDGKTTPRIVRSKEKAVFRSEGGIWVELIEVCFTHLN